MSPEPPFGFPFARRWWWAITAVCAVLFGLFMVHGWFWIGIVAVLGWIFVAAAKFTQPPHDF